MTYEEYWFARLALAEKRIGAPLRAQDRADMAKERATQDILRARGLVAEGA